MISNNISWSTCMNFWSHSSISVVFLRESESSSLAAAGSLRWCSHHSITFLRTDSLTCEFVLNLNAICAYWIAEWCAYIWNWDGAVQSTISEILHHMLDQNGLLGDLAIYCNSQHSVPGLRRKVRRGIRTNFHGDSIIGGKLDLGDCSVCRHLECCWKV